MVEHMMQQIYSTVNVISGLIVGLSVLMIVYAGFKYVTSQGDPRETEQAKMQIMSSGIGIFIVMLANVILKVLMTANGVSHKPTHVSGSAIVIFLIVFSVICSIVVISGHAAKKAEKKATSEPSKVTVEEEQIEEVINETPIVFSLEEQVKQFESEPVIFEKLHTILSHLHLLREKLDELDTESKHKVEESIEYDLTRLLSNFENISEENKESYTMKVTDRLDKINDELHHIDEKLENKKLFELEKSLQIIDARYDH